MPALLAANPRLAAAEPVLPAGLLIVLPELSAAAPSIRADRLSDVALAGVVLPERRPVAAVAGTARITARTLGAPAGL